MTILVLSMESIYLWWKWLSHTFVSLKLEVFRKYTYRYHSLSNFYLKLNIYLISNSVSSAPMFILYELAVAFEKLYAKADAAQTIELNHLYFLKRQAFWRRRYQLRDRRVMMAIRICHELHDEESQVMDEEEEVLPHSRHSILR